MEYRHLEYETLRRFCRDSFLARGFSEDEAATICDVLLTADCFGIESHGVQRLRLYHDSIDKGLIRPQNKPEILFETPVSALVDGRDGMGQLVGRFCMETAIGKAKRAGIGLVAARNSNHYGIAGYYARLAEREGLIGVSMTNSEAILVPTNGLRPMLGTNPIAVCAPAEPIPFWFDAATTVVPRGKLEVYKKRGKPIPEGWAMDETGKNTTDAERVLRNIDARALGGQLPLGGISEVTGGHKGYGYAMLCEIATSVFSGGPPSGHTYAGSRCLTSQFFAALRPDLFGDAEGQKDRLSGLLREIRESARADEGLRVFTHGEKEWESEKRIRQTGVPAAPKTIEEMRDVGKRTGLDWERYWRDIL